MATAYWQRISLMRNEGILSIEMEQPIQVDIEVTLDKIKKQSITGNGVTPFLQKGVNSYVKVVSLHLKAF
jgi:pseudouridine-5'-phosphate glycosidase